MQSSRHWHLSYCITPHKRGCVRACNQISVSFRMSQVSRLGWAPKKPADREHSMLRSCHCQVCHRVYTLIGLCVQYGMWCPASARPKNRPAGDRLATRLEKHRHSRFQNSIPPGKFALCNIEFYWAIYNRSRMASICSLVLASAEISRFDADL